MTSKANVVSQPYKRVYNFFKSKKSIYIFNIIIIITLIIFQHRFWLYSNIYINFSKQIGTGGATYQSIFVYLQNNLNFINRSLYSLQAAQYTWYDKIFVINEFNYFPSLIYGLFYWVTKNYITSFNLLFFGNLILLQIGVYFLTKHYTKNNIVSIFAALFVPLSQSFKTFYTHHIHASLYAGLPFLILFLEIYIKNKDLSRKNKIWLLMGVFTTLCSILLNGWHIITFSFVWIIIWLISNSLSIYRVFKHKAKKFYAILGVAILVVALLVPVALQIQKNIKIYSNPRSEIDISATNLNTHSFWYGKPISYIDSKISGYSTEIIDKTRPTLENLRLSYPDALSSISFVIGNIVFIPWLFLLIKKRGKFHPTEFSLLSLFLFTHWIALGPFVKTFGSINLQIVLPHYYIYKVYLLFQSIRAIWRITFVGYLGLLILWSMIISKLMKKFIYSRTSSILKFYSNFILIVCLVILMVYVNGLWVGSSELAFQPSSFWKENFDKLTKNGPVDYYNIDLPGRSTLDADQRNVSLFLGKYNLDNKKQLINLVSGAGAGSSIDSDILSNLQSDETRYSQLATILSAKSVDVLTIKNRQIEDKELLEKEVKKYYTKYSEDKYDSFWKLNEKTDDVINELETKISISDIQPSDGKIHGFFNQENNSEQIYVNLEKVIMEKYEVKIESSNSVFTKEIEYPSTSVLLPEYGRSKLFEINVKKLLPGDYVFKLYKEGEEIFSKNIEVINKIQYDNLIKQNQDELKINSTIIKNKYQRSFSSLKNLKMDLNITQGVLSSFPSDLNYQNEKVFQSQFYLEDQFEYTYNFPEHIGQVNCNVYGNFFPGDNIEFWCQQEVPIDSRYKDYNLVYKNNPNPPIKIVSVIERITKDYLRKFKDKLF